MKLNMKGKIAHDDSGFTRLFIRRYKNNTTFILLCNEECKLRFIVFFKIVFVFYSIHVQALLTVLTHLFSKLILRYRRIGIPFCCSLSYFIFHFVLYSYPLSFFLFYIVYIIFLIPFPYIL